MHFDETSKLDDASASLDGVSASVGDASAPDAPVRGPSSRTAERQRQQFDERDRAIRDAARRLLLERGLHGFSMDDVAAAIAYSKGTVYQHYDSKEDVLVASCAEAAAELAETFERAAALPLRSRERMTAIVEAYCEFVERHAVSFRVIPLVHSPTVREKAKPERIAAMEVAQARVRAACAAVVDAAVAAGDLRPPAGVDVRTIPFALWSLMFGAFMLTELHSSEKTFGVRDPVAAIRVSWALHMDGLRWAPVGGEADPAATGRRIRDLLVRQAPRPLST